METRQRAQLTGTNRSFGLIALVAKARQIITGDVSSTRRRLKQLLEKPFCFKTFFAGLVALGEAIRPDPIPNSAVKRLSANGTLSQDTGE